MEKALLVKRGETSFFSIILTNPNKVNDLICHNLIGELLGLQSEIVINKKQGYYIALVSSKTQFFEEEKEFLLELLKS